MQSPSGTAAAIEHARIQWAGGGQQGDTTIRTLMTVARIGYR